MDRNRLRAVLVFAVGLLAAGLLLYPYVPATMTLTGTTYDAATVTVVDENGTALGSVGVAVADTPDERYRGLSGVDALPPDRGMLFVFHDEGARAFVMRDMSVPLDIVFVGADGQITAIHHAPVPPPGTDEANLTRYTGRAKWVLEVNRGWATRHGVSVGDRVRIEYTHGRPGPANNTHALSGSGTLLPANHFGS